MVKKVETNYSALGEGGYSPILPQGRGEVLPYMYIGYTGMCCWKGYGFQAIWSGKGYGFQLKSFGLVKGLVIIELEN